ncbi:MAG: carboxylesterase family protein [Cellvibrionaceae bacterium]
MKTFTLVLIISLFLQILSAHGADQSSLGKPVNVVTHSGEISGSQINIPAKINVFKGVPFAKPPVGELRWMPPKPIHWEGVRDATKFSLPCLQRTNSDGSWNGAGVSGESSEDCLYLNIWAPANAKKAPIMLWVFGGGGVMGAGSVPTYNGKAFARDGIILVTVNYRLGALGGFSTPALTAEARETQEGFGNYHLLDVMAALRWVKDNAEAFGGDQNNIILFGESAGATITANLVTSPMAKELFDKAIIESTGSLPTPATTLEAAEKRGVEALENLGFNGNDSVNELREISAEDIIMDRKNGRGIRTILDGRVKTQSILDSFSAGNENDVPMIIGTNSDEGRLRGTQLVATHAQDGEPVWQYFFDYVPEWRGKEQPNGAPHAAEIPYVFDTLIHDRRVGKYMTEKDNAVAKRIHSCWVAFAKLPAGSKTIDCAEGFRWPARTDKNNKAVAIFQEFPSLGQAEELRSPPNGAKPGPTSRP